MNDKIRVLFMGTPEFSVPCLEALIKSGYDVVGAVTQPDKPKGRGHKLIPTPVKACAAEHGIEVFQPETLKNEALKPVLERTEPDIIIVVAYGKILPEYILSFPRLGCINVHASLLPRYRGAGPIQWSVINGESVTGVTTMYMERGLDTGDMILKKKTPIGENETSGELHDRLSLMGAELLIKTVEEIINGTAPREKQDDSLSCYAPMIDKETGHIDWSKPKNEILNLIRGVNPWPMSYSNYCGEPMKIISAHAGGNADGAEGEIILADKNGITVVCGGKESVVITEIQMKGGKRMHVASYLNGHTIEAGTVLE